jgi:hypothetical protein
MVRKRKYGNWQRVQLTENLISKGVDGLIGEQLTTVGQYGGGFPPLPAMMNDVMVA